MRLLAPLLPRCVTALFMHRFAVPDLGVQGHDPARLASHLEYLRRHRYRLMGLRELLNEIGQGTPIAQNALIFTVDDGYADFAEVGAPVFAAYDCPVTVFLVTDFVGGRAWNWFDHIEWAFGKSDRDEIDITLLGTRINRRWSTQSDRAEVCADFVERLKRIRDSARRDAIRWIAAALDVDIPERAPEQYRAMTWDQVRACGQAGATFGPHTVSHPILSQLEDSEAELEIAASWRAVSKETEAAVPVFCYPNGTALDFGSREKDAVAAAGMRAALSTMGGSVPWPESGLTVQDKFALPRFAYPEDPPTFAQVASGLEETKRRIRRWLK